MDPLTKSLDVRHDINTIEEEIAEYEREQEDVAERSGEVDPPQTDEEEAELRELEVQFQTIEQRLTQLRGQKEALERAVREWEGSEIVIRELTASEVRVIEDEAAHKANKRGLDDPSDGLWEAEFMQRTIHTTPPGCPDPENIGDLPDRTFNWLLRQANMLNSTGEFEMGNSSTRTKMREMRRNHEN